MEGTTGQPWTAVEIEMVIEAYFAMLEWQLDGLDFVKADVRAEVDDRLPARSKKSIEFKWCNISAVLEEMELPWVDGYKPLANIQRALVEAVQDWLDTHTELRQKLGA